ncbi:hypothetical protein [Myxococcus sp. AB025B]|uniref:hypothetical protein n=1 Tax=Myxococcus sp. AB025B TaxID=2562794 RepID=UPI00114450EC|nr:hypothetical protein [Myxococcus sp. AB025B]
MDARDIHPKWVVNLVDEPRELYLWLGWSSLAELLEAMTELSTTPNTYFRFTFSESTLASLGELLARVEDCHATPEPYRAHPRQLSVERLASAANEVHQQAQRLQDKLAEPGFAHALAVQKVMAPRAFLDAWATLLRQLGSGRGPHPPLLDCTGDVDVSLEWGW